MSASPERIVQLRDLFRRVWPEAIGGTPSRGALQVALGICGVEGWGNWDDGMWGSNNFGGVQCLPGQEANGDGVHYVGVPHVDHHYDGTEYTTWFRYYIDGGGHTAEENGAIGFLQQVAHRRLRDGRDSGAAAALARGSAYDTAKAMHDSGYYEGNPPDPVAEYANGIVKNATIAAAALGEPVLVDGGNNMKRNLALFAAGLAIAHGMGWV